MNWNILNSLDRSHRAPTIACLFALVAVLGIAAVAVSPAAAQESEVLNETVEVDNDTASVYVEAQFASGIDDANATAIVTVTDANGTELANESIAGNASETIVEEWQVNDSDPTGNYSVVVTAESGIVDTADAGTFDVLGGGGGSGDSSSDGWGTIYGYPAWMVAILVAAVALYGLREGWWEDLA